MNEPAGNLESHDDMGADIMDAFGEVEGIDQEVSLLGAQDFEEDDDSSEIDGGDDSEAEETVDSGAEDDFPGGIKKGDAEGEEAKLSAPEHWPAADKEMFKAAVDVDPEFGQWLLDKKTDIEKDAQAKWQEAAKMRKENEGLFNLGAHAIRQVDNIVKRYPAHAMMDHGKVIQTMSAWWDGLTNNQTKMQAYQDLGKQLGIDQMLQSEDESIDPEVKALRQEILALKGSQQQATAQQRHEQWQKQQQAIQAQQAQAGSQIQQFAEAVDESGSLKFPHFSKVHQTMGVLLKADMEAGGQMSMEDAYALATAKAGLSNSSPAERLRKAKRAASGVRAKRGSSNNDDHGFSDRDLIEMVMDGKIT